DARLTQHRGRVVVEPHELLVLFGAGPNLVGPLQDEVQGFVSHDSYSPISDCGRNWRSSVARSARLRRMWPHRYRTPWPECRWHHPPARPPEVMCAKSPRG